MQTPLLLDFDDAVRTGAADVPAPTRINLRGWQETIRFGCSMRHWRALRAELSKQLPEAHGTALLGSGDFHHLSHLLIERCVHPQLDVVVLDNHPDNMRFPFGIHCGSWVKHVARLPWVRQVHVLGICSADVSRAHAWENYLHPFFAGKLHYWTVGVDATWLRLLGRGAQARSFADVDALGAAFADSQRGEQAPVYLSIDKDVFDASVAHTNWDQGRMILPQAEAIIAALSGRIVASDITGEVSVHAYQTRWKRWLSALDSQPEIQPTELADWQVQQAQVNHALLRMIAQHAR